MKTGAGVHPPFEIAWATDRGYKRQRYQNEDNIWISGKVNAAQPPLLLVADGMGGHKGGALASQLVVKAFAQCYRSLLQAGDVRSSWQPLLQNCVFHAHEQIHHHSKTFPEMGSTVVATLLFPEQVVGVNVGDSRAYLFEHNGWKRISRDHSIAEQMVQQGEITPLEALRHPKRNRLTQSLSAHRPSVTPYFFSHPWGPGTVLLLCSDGLWEVVPESVMHEIIMHRPAAEAVKHLIRLGNDLGGPDNLSVVVARYRQK